MEMEKSTRTGETATWKDTAEEAVNLILQHSWNRILHTQKMRPAQRKAYECLAVTIVEAVKAFIALDESFDESQKK
jgi:hypothetical protein